MDKKTSSTILLVIAILFIAFGITSGWFSSYVSYLENDNSTFIVGLDPVNPPFGYKADNGSYTGFEIDVAQEVCKRNNWTLAPQDIANWETKDAQLNAAVIDCVWSEFSITGHEDNYTWSKPYYKNQEVFVVKKDSEINTISDLSGKKVDVKEKSTALENLNNANKTVKDTFQVTEVESYEKGFEDIQSGTCDALLIDEASAKYHIKENGSGEYKILNETLNTENYAIAFKKGNEELKNKIQQTIDQMYADGTMNKIAQKYADYGIPEGMTQ